MNTIIVSDTSSNSIVSHEPRPLDQNPAMAYLIELNSEHSRRNGKRYLAQIANGMQRNQWQTPQRPDYDSADEYKLAMAEYNAAAFTFEWSALRSTHTGAIRSKLLELYQPGTVNVMLSALRKVLYHAWKLYQMDIEDYRRAADIGNVASDSLPAGREATDNEITDLSAVCQRDETAAGIRDAAIIAWMITQGPRRDEIAKTRRQDVSLTQHPKTGAEVIAIKIMFGKRRKQRMNYLDNGAYDAMLDWLALRGDEPGPLFLPIDKAGTVIKTRADKKTGEQVPAGLTSQAIYNMIDKRCKQAGITDADGKADLSPHDFRRTVAGDLTEKSDVIIAQKTLGHASVNTTQRYDRRPEGAKIEAASKMHFPYRRRRA